MVRIFERMTSHACIIQKLQGGGVARPIQRVDVMFTPTSSIQLDLEPPDRGLLPVPLGFGHSLQGTPTPEPTSARHILHLRDRPAMSPIPRAAPRDSEAPSPGSSFRPSWRACCPSSGFGGRPGAADESSRRPTRSGRGPVLGVGLCIAVRPKALNRGTVGGSVRHLKMEKTWSWRAMIM